MTIRIDKVVEYKIDGQYVIGTVKTVSPRTGQNFFPKSETMIARLEEKMSSYALESLIKELQLVKNYLDSKKVASELSETLDSEDEVFYLE